jgi:hypothetical protein
VLGARQVGKTTLVEHVAGGRDAGFRNLDLEVDKARFLAAAALPPADALCSFGSPPLLNGGRGAAPARVQHHDDAKIAAPAVAGEGL